MASYMPQPDSGNTCCDCPSRTSPCDDCATTGGACCNFDTQVCSPSASHDACVASGGIYLGDGTTCDGVDCTCCPLFDPYTEIHFSGQVLGCTGGTITLPEQIWTKTNPFGCNLSVFEFAHKASCSCIFKARNCFPNTEVDYVAIDEVGTCDFPPYQGCLFLAHILCNGTVTFEGGTGPPQCCNTAVSLSLTAPYDITAGAIDVTLSMGSGISVRLMLSLS